MRRFLTKLAWPYGIAYAMLWLAFLWFAADGALIRNNPGCSPIESAPLPLWTCSEFGATYLLTLLIDIALLAIMWAPVFIAAATVNLATVPLAVPLIFGHVMGVTALIYALIKALQWLTHNTVLR